MFGLSSKGATLDGMSATNPLHDEHSESEHPESEYRVTWHRPELYTEQMANYLKWAAAQGVYATFRDANDRVIVESWPMNKSIANMREMLGLSPAFEETVETARRDLGS